MTKKFPLLIIMLFAFLNIALAQNSTVKGKVSDSRGEPLAGVTIKIANMQSVTATDAKGNYTITVPPNATLTFSYVGFATLDAQVGSTNTLNVTLTVTENNLNEVVVVGYGTQKKSLVTGSISSVTSKELENMPINRVEQALEGRASGINVSAASGLPGASSTIRIRGYTSFSPIANNDPLWVIDGVIVDNGGIGYLNEADIESIEVLKDAASAAIYGTRAANGVILVTTKKGKAGQVKVDYNGYYGTQTTAKKLDLLNATQYATIRDESFMNTVAYQNAVTKPALPFANPASLGVGTDWQSLVFSKAPIQNHQFSVSGGSDKSTFFTSFGYLDQRGIVAKDISGYKRINIRLNSTYNLAKWLTLGENLGYDFAKTQSNGGNYNTEFGGTLSDAVNLDPVTPVYQTDPNILALAPYTGANAAYPAKGPNGLYYAFSPYVGQEMSNPLAYIQSKLGNYNWEHNIVGNVFAEVSPIRGLKFRSSLGTKLAFYGSESYTPYYYFTSSSIGNKQQFNRSITDGLAYNLENTLTYSRSIGKHSVSAVVGQGIYMDNDTKNVNVNYANVIATSFYQANLQYKPVTGDITGGGSDGTEHRITSLFARLNYDYDEKYLVTGTVRRDGSSRFGANYQFGVFPSFSLGWVPSLEKFWPKNDAVSFLKIKGGYGVTGNDGGIGDFAFNSIISGGRNYTFGTANASTIGFSPAAPANPNLRWEQTQSTDIGLDAVLFNNFNLSVDLFTKKTVGVLQQPPVPGYLGYSQAPYANYGTSQNRGIDIELGYHSKIGDLSFGMNGNVSFLQNKILYIAPGISFVETQQASFQTMGNISRSIVGGSYNAFYGYQMLGIFQTQAEVNSYVGSAGTPLQPNAKPGDIKYANLNGDNVIDGSDRTIIGNPIPTVTYGLTVNLVYKSFDFVAFGNGVGGNSIFQGLRRLDIGNANYQTTILDRWTPTNPSTTNPRLTDDDPNGNYTKFSKIYLQSGNYFRVKTMQLGYTLPKGLTKKLGVNRLRIYASALNLFTFTKYTGYDPEIGNGGAGAGQVLGIDKGNYPQARTFMLGLNLGF
ncbi:TonB-dependent receptor [Mucilaginibacter sp.]|uniref:SusC/RagA family TonB-linked outer membrane protein n=1 Tax=Mucilaginibacter sp. TaxID=1882438 RepID=UPI002634899D|nr:TonB-dependent receptor [Mucilaginibacter sp.]MDB5031847.1 SusC/RagA family TonB-linked outer membrane protein [Mucilaginibacter sp.]